MNQALGVVHHHYFILLYHRHQDVLQLVLPKFPFVKLRFHRLARRQVRKAAHEEEGIGIFNGEKWTQDLHPDFFVRRKSLGVEDLKKPRAAARLELVRPHFYDHLKTSSSRIVNA